MGFNFSLRSVLLYRHTTGGGGGAKHRAGGQEGGAGREVAAALQPALGQGLPPAPPGLGGGGRVRPAGLLQQYKPAARQGCALPLPGNYSSFTFTINSVQSKYHQLLPVHRGALEKQKTERIAEPVYILRQPVPLVIMNCSYRNSKVSKTFPPGATDPTHVPSLQCQTPVGRVGCRTVIPLRVAGGIFQL